MAQRAESLNADPTVPATVVPMPDPTRTDGGTANQVRNAARDSYNEVARKASDAVNNVAAKASDAVNSVAAKASDAYENVAERVNRAKTEATQRLESMAGDVSSQLRRTREENPMMFVAIAAGAGFLAGVLLRVWRSSRYE